MTIKRYNSGIQRAKGFLELAAALYDSSLSSESWKAAEVSFKPMRAWVTRSGSRSPPSQTIEKGFRSLSPPAAFARSKRWPKANFPLPGSIPRCC